MKPGFSLAKIYFCYVVSEPVSRNFVGNQLVITGAPRCIKTPIVDASVCLFEKRKRTAYVDNANIDDLPPDYKCAGLDVSTLIIFSKTKQKKHILTILLLLQIFRHTQHPHVDYMCSSKYNVTDGKYLCWRHHQTVAEHGYYFDASNKWFYYINQKEAADITNKVHFKIAAEKVEREAAKAETQILIDKFTERLCKRPASASLPSSSSTSMPVRMRPLFVPVEVKRGPLYVPPPHPHPPTSTSTSIPDIVPVKISLWTQLVDTFDSSTPTVPTTAIATEELVVPVCTKRQRNESEDTRPHKMTFRSMLNGLSKVERELARDVAPEDLPALIQMLRETSVHQSSTALPAKSKKVYSCSHCGKPGHGKHHCPERTCEDTKACLQSSKTLSVVVQKSEDISKCAAALLGLSQIKSTSRDAVQTHTSCSSAREILAVVESTELWLEKASVSLQQFDSFSSLHKYMKKMYDPVVLMHTNNAAELLEVDEEYVRVHKNSTLNVNFMNNSMLIKGKWKC